MHREIEYLLDELDKADPGRKPEVRQLIEKLSVQKIGKDVAQNLINEAFKDELIVDAFDRSGRTKYTTVPENIQCDLTIKGFEYLNQIRIKKAIEKFNASSDKTAAAIILLTIVLVFLAYIPVSNTPVNILAGVFAILGIIVVIGILKK